MQQNIHGLLGPQMRFSAIQAVIQFLAQSNQANVNHVNVNICYSFQLTLLTTNVQLTTSGLYLAYKHS